MWETKFECPSEFSKREKPDRNSSPHRMAGRGDKEGRMSVTLDNSTERPGGQDSIDHDPGMGFSFLSFYGYT